MTNYLILFRFFIKQLLSRFSLFFICLVPIFASCDIIVRLTTINFSFKFFRFFVFILPLVSVFAIPISVCLSVGITVGDIFSRNEFLFFNFFPSIRRRLEFAILVFAVIFSLFFAPLIFKWAPEGYWNGKKFLIHTIQRQIEDLSPQRFHQIASRCTIFFKKKKFDKQCMFEDILLMMRDKNNKKYLITSRSGTLYKGILELFDGTIYNNDEKNHCVATFKSLEIAFERIFFGSDKKIRRAKKFLTIKELFKISESDDDAWKEIHKRFLQLLWQLLLPLMILWVMVIFSRQKSNILLGVVVSSSMFFLSYLNINMAYFFLSRTWWAITIFYSLPIALSFVLYKLYRSRF